MPQVIKVLYTLHNPYTVISTQVLSTQVSYYGSYILVLLLCLTQLSNIEYSVLIRNWKRTKILYSLWSTSIILEHLFFVLSLYEQVKGKSQSPPWDRPSSVPQISQRLCISTDNHDSPERVVSASYKNLKFSYN